MILRNSKGETFIETLVAILILTVVITGFSNVIATTAKLNHAVKNKRNTIAKSDYTLASDSNKWKIKVSETGETYDVQVYYDDVSGLYYYESDQTKFKKIESE